MTKTSEEIAKWNANEAYCSSLRQENAKLREVAELLHKHLKVCKEIFENNAAPREWVSESIEQALSRWKLFQNGEQQDGGGSETVSPHKKD